MRRNQTILLSATLAFTVGITAIANTAPSWAQMRLRGHASQTTQEANRLFQIGQWSHAEKAYTNAVKQNPKNARNVAGLSLVQAQLFKLDAAEKNAHRALSLNPKDPYAHIALGDVLRNRTASSDMTYRSQRDVLLNQAIDHYNQALRYDPNNPDAYNHLGETYRMMGQTDEARMAFQKAVSLDPKFSEALANLGTIYQQEGQTDAAIQNYRRAITLNSKNDRAHYYLGQALMKKGMYHEALKSLNTALSLNHNSAQIHTTMGEALEAQGNQAAAISHYREAIRTKPEFVDSYRHLANLFNSRGDSEFGIAELKSALNSNPKHTPFKMEIGRMSLLAEKPQQAVNYYSEVLKEQPNNPEALEGLAQAYSMLAYQTASSGETAGADRYVDAEQAIDAAIRSNPNNVQLYLAKLRIGRLSGATQLPEAELRRLVNQPVYTQADSMARAEALFELGQFQESDQAYRQLIQQNGRNLSELSAMADALTVSGNLDMAQSAYQQIQQSDPNNLKASRGIQRISTRRNEAQKSSRLATALDSRFSGKRKRSAQDFYMESAALYPRQAEVRKELGDGFARQDQYAKAALEYEAYMNLDTTLTDKQRQHWQKKISDLRNKATTQAQTASFNPRP